MLHPNSAWFKDALGKASMANGDQDDLYDQPKGINLADKDPAIFSRFNQWVYTQKVCSRRRRPR